MIPDEFLHPSYIHHLPAIGRLRINFKILKNNPKKLRRVAKDLADLPGVQEVSLSSSTGGLLVLYSPDCLDIEAIESVLSGHEILCPNMCLSGVPNTPVISEFNPLEVLTLYLVEETAKWLIFSLV